ncbi:RNA polymerase sigma-70 factor [Xanthocytophaga flava]|uniref:RNA polymerase sigma-70 factor n=1 Tax=Xanthocytophaga flava TaxID=3048013 RepID=UPI0028D1733B|nr:RNA polymerase sigma-70 factor [Xanthocytophaga flavus]MDJ1467756.1 RNA polymerase sigma-70 factor [Xanthocytophaga flavus]
MNLLETPYRPLFVSVSDQQLIEAIRKGDKQSFEIVFKQYYRTLCEYAFTIVKDTDEARDIVQSMFLKIWERREDLIITLTLKAYLYRAVHNTCLNRIKHESIKTKYIRQSIGDGRQEVKQPEAFANETEKKVMKAIDDLPEQCRIIFKLSRFEEMSYADIAQKLNISVQTVANQVSKALKVLRTQLTDTD